VPERSSHMSGGSARGLPEARSADASRPWVKERGALSRRSCPKVTRLQSRALQGTAAQSMATRRPTRAAWPAWPMA